MMPGVKVESEHPVIQPGRQAQSDGGIRARSVIANIGRNCGFEDDSRGVAFDELPWPGRQWRAKRVGNSGFERHGLRCVADPKPEDS